MFETIVNWALRYKIKKMKKKYRWLFLLKEYYDFEVWKHFIIIITVSLMSVGWSSICESLGLSNSYFPYPMIVIIPSIILIMMSAISLFGKFLQRIFSRK